MEAVGHHPLRVAVLVEEAVREVAPKHVLAVAVPADFAVHRVVAETVRVVLVRAAREDRRQHDLGLRLLRADLLQDVADAEDGVHRRLVGEFLEVSGVVRADHEEHALRLVAVEFAVVETPQHMLRAVAARSEVEHLPVALGEVLLLLILALAFPEVGD